MLFAPVDDHQLHRSPFHSLRVQLLFLLVSSLLLPGLVIALVRGPGALAVAPTVWSGLIGFSAAIATLLSIRRIGSVYGATLSRWILSTFVLFTFIGIAFLFSFRLPYSAATSGLSFFISLTALYLLSALMNRNRRAVCYIVPIGRTMDFDFDWDVPLEILDAPFLPENPASVLVADLHADLGPRWESLLTEAALKGYPVFHYSQLREAMTGKVQFDHLSENSFGARIHAQRLSPVSTYGTDLRL